MSGMEAALLGGVIKVFLPMLFSMASHKYKLSKSVKGNIKFLLDELEMIVAATMDHHSWQPVDRRGRTAEQLAADQLSELAHDMEDCMERIMYSAAAREQQPSKLGRALRWTLDLQPAQVQELQKLRKLVEEAHQRRQRYAAPGPGQSHSQPPSSSSSSAAHVEGEEGQGSSSFVASDPRLLDSDLVGVEVPLAELEAQLAEGQPEQLKVVSIVGFCGLGKTALAGELYRRATGRRGNGFAKHAWVCATHKGPREVLTEMLRKLSTTDAPSAQGSVLQLLDTSDIAQLCVDVRHKLKNNRYFIVIDDIRSEDKWQAIKLAFPVNKDISSRIVVTTTVQSIANSCSSANGYVHKISKLNKEFSEKLFSEKACPEKYSSFKPPNSAAILKKCDGQPLALVTIGEFLQTNGWPSGPKCEDFCSNLPYHLKNERTFEKMRQLLIRNYSSLPGHALKACLLYFGMFPIDHPIRRKSLLRRWLAEGFVGIEPSPLAAFDELMNQNIIEPINLSNNDNIKTCQTYSMMHEIILHMCISRNFMTLFQDDKIDPFCGKKIEPKYVRRLSLHRQTAEGDDGFDSVDYKLVRSLTIFGRASKTILDFSKYQLLRVLDLEKCDDLKDDHLDDICSLLLLKYLSLGMNVTTLPRDITKLKNLGTLDLRRTKVKILPVEVFQLPCLIHLLGMFKLPDKVNLKSEVCKFLSKGKSKLETLAGFATDGSEGFLHLFMGYMTKLRKVKISMVYSTSDWADLTKAIQQFIHDEEDANMGTRSLSLHFNEYIEVILNSLKGPCYLSSLKLHGNLHALPQFVVSLRGLVELCISSTRLKTCVLQALSNLSYLKYLKLIALDLEQEEFIIKDHSFPRMVNLYIEVQCPTFLMIEEGALSFLITLQLLCKDLDALAYNKIQHLRNLQVVTLSRGINKETREKWENAAKKHPNRPKIKYVDTTKSNQINNSIALELTENESTQNSITTEGPVQGITTQLLQNQEQKSSFAPNSKIRCAISSSLNSLPNSSWNNMRHSEASLTLNEFSDSMVESDQDKILDP